MKPSSSPYLTPQQFLRRQKIIYGWHLTAGIATTAFCPPGLRWLFGTYLLCVLVPGIKHYFLPWASSAVARLKARRVPRREITIDEVLPPDSRPRWPRS